VVSILQFCAYVEVDAYVRVQFEYLECYIVTLLFFMFFDCVYEVCLVIVWLVIVAYAAH